MHLLIFIKTYEWMHLPPCSFRNFIQIQRAFLFRRHGSPSSFRCFPFISRPPQSNIIQHQCFVSQLLSDALLLRFLLLLTNMHADILIYKISRRLTNNRLSNSKHRVTSNTQVKEPGGMGACTPSTFQLLSGVLIYKDDRHTAPMPH